MNCFFSIQTPIGNWKFPEEFFDFRVEQIAVLYENYVFEVKINWKNNWNKTF